MLKTTQITLDQPGFDSLEIELEQMGEAERKEFCKRALHIEHFTGTE